MQKGHKEKRVALVAGASSGLGAAVAQRLSKEGFVTYAAARSYRAGKAPPPGCLPIPLDVTDDASVDNAIARLLSEQGRVDVLVNCAAFFVLGACEDLSAEELRAVLETNFLGMARLTRAVLPAMRAQSTGHIIQFSSLNGLFGIPFQGAYAASKHAIEGWSEALAMEVRPHGIQVTLVEPGDCKSGSAAYRQTARAAEKPESPYRAALWAATQRIHHDENNGLAPEKVAHAVARALAKRRAPARVVVARLDQRLAMWLHDLLPGRLFFRILLAYYAPRRQRSHRPGES